MNKKFFILLTLLASANIHAQTAPNSAALCAGCHGQNGISLGDEFPNLAGQKSAYLSKQLHAFKNKTRVNATMNAMAQNLTDDNITELAHYFSQLPQHATSTEQFTNINSKAINTNYFPATIYASMKASAKVTSFPQQHSIAGGENMLYTALTPDASILLSTSPSTGTVYLFDTKTMHKKAVIKVGKAPKGVKVTPDGKLAYVSNQGSNNISVIDLHSLKNIATITTPAGPHNVRFTKNGQTAYVTLQGGAGIGVINTKQQKLTKVIAIKGITGPHNLDISQDEKTAYVRDFVHHVAVVDLTTEKVIKVITVGNGHGGIDVLPNNKFVATAAIGDTFISVINSQTLALKNIELGTASHGIRASKDSRWLYVTLPKANAIAVIDTKTWQIVEKIAVDKFPFWIAVQGNA